MKRRRFLKVAACAVPGLTLPRIAAAAAARELPVYSWNGYVLGAEGGFRICGDPARAKRAAEACFTEIRRLEAVFSLYRRDSALSRLNGTGALDTPPPELLEVLELCAGLYRATGGAFDPSVQPLWRLYADHFAAASPDPRGPGTAAIRACLASTGFGQVGFDPAEVRFARPRMRLTLNGIAQGYITDRVTGILASEGFEHALVELGETRALGERPGGGSWRLGIAAAGGRGLFETVELDGRAIATSGGYGSRFDPSGRFHHLIDPRDGRPANTCAATSVIADRAALADAWSTGLAIMDDAEAARLAEAHSEIRMIRQPLRVG